MDFIVYIFAAILGAVGLLLVLHVKGALWREPPAVSAREQQLAAYEERRMRVRRDRVWMRIETLHSEFIKREEAAAPGESTSADEQPAAAGTARRPPQPPAPSRPHETHPK